MQRIQSTVNGLYTESRGFQNHFSQFYILKEKPDVKTSHLYEFVAEFLKNVQYLEIVNPKQLWRIDYQVGIFWEKYYDLR